jgi:hypothetical protein
MRAVPARASQATFEERWTLGRGLQVRSGRAVFGLRACVRAFKRFGRWATVLSACALLAQLENILREYPIELQCVQLRPKPHSLRRPFGLVDPPWRGTGPSVGPSPLNRTAAKAVGRSVRDWVSG